MDTLFSDPPNTTPERIATLDRLAGPFDPTPCSICGKGIRLGGTTVITATGPRRLCCACRPPQNESGR